MWVEYKQKSRSSEAGFIRNPTLAAMVGSAIFHGVIVLAAVLNPAASKTSNPLRIISLAPPTNPSGFSKPGSPLLVPNVQPPVNLGSGPGSSPLPDISKFRTAPSPSMYLGGANLPSISMRNLQSRNIPLPSFQTPGVPNFNGFGLPSTGNPGGNGPSGFNPPPNGMHNSETNAPGLNTTQPNPFESSRKPTASVPNYRDYAVAKNPDIPAVASENFQNSGPANFPYARLSPPSPPTGPLSPTPSNPPQTTATALSPLNREELKTFRKTMSDRVGQELSFQVGPTLTATYPPSACASQQSDSAMISAVFGPDGNLASGADAITVARSASNIVLNQAAIAAVQGYRAPAAQGYQLFNFTVDIPYSASVCKAANPGPSSTPSQSPTTPPLSSPSTQPSVVPTSKPGLGGQPIQPDQPKRSEPQVSPTSPPQAQPSKLPTPSIQPEPSPGPIIPEATPTPSSVPSEGPSAPSPNATVEPSNSSGESPQMEPLPTPSVTVPDAPQP